MITDQKKVWLRPLPKIEKELELMKICVDSIHTTNLMEKSATKEAILHHASNILLRYLQQLDTLTTAERRVYSADVVNFEIEE